ncbi:acetyl-CoA sensor PanZ family protein [Halomonas salifodinae]|uniref:acetyl-CoA sensor PanZ family protein n=1 Tax=Halomonas salifodinae TaxID=438745 RepID=UPI0033B7A0AB
MPVTLHRVDHATWAADAQVALDLSRIYADAPAQRLPLPADDYIRQHLESRGTFCCARFNDRLLGAVAVMEDPEAWWLANICVRKTTRRRGVGSRLLALVGEAANREGRVLRIASETLTLDDQLLLSRLGYRPAADGRYFQFEPPATGGTP